MQTGRRSRSAGHTKSLMTTAILLIAHGSRNPAANADLDQLAAEVRRRGRYDLVETAYLELAEPTIAQAAQRCAAQGMQKIILAPYFLSAGVHVCDDLRRLRDELAERFPASTFLLAEPLGPHPMLAEIVLQRTEEVAKQIEPTGNDSTRLARFDKSLPHP